jgi:Zn-finger nucleic acid-binding protein
MSGGNMNAMKCPHCNASSLTELHIGGTIAHVCLGLLFTKVELMKLKDNIEAYGWFDISLWETKELLKARDSSLKCPSCSTQMRTVDWNNGELISSLCPSCGSLWLLKGEYEKAMNYIKASADGEILEHYGAVLSREIESILTGEKNVIEEAHNLVALVRFFEYRFVTKHPLLTEVIEELPFTT